MNTDNVLRKLKSGNNNFVNGNLSNKNKDSIRRSAVINTQNPFAVILACSDSRVIPELIFDTGIGELFTVRVAGNIANTSSIASIEYAVAHLDVKVLVVLGHQNCGAITAAISGNDLGNNIQYLLKHIDPAITMTNDSSIDSIAVLNAKITAQKLCEDSIIISNASYERKIKIIPAFYSLETGKVNFSI